MFDKLLALHGRDLTDTTILFALAALTQPLMQRFERGADSLHHFEPRHAEKKGAADGECGEQQQRCAIEAECAGERIADRIAKGTARRERQYGG